MFINKQNGPTAPLKRSVQESYFLCQPKQTIKKIFKKKNVQFVFSVLKDKLFDKISSIAHTHNAHIIFVQSASSHIKKKKKQNELLE